MRTYMDFGQGDVGIDDMLIKATKRKNQAKQVYVNVYNGKLVRRISDGKNNRGHWEFLARDVSRVTGKPKATWLKSDWDDREYLDQVSGQYVLFFDPNQENSELKHG